MAHLGVPFLGGNMITKILSIDDSAEIASIEDFCEHSRITDLYDELVVQQCLDAAHDLVQKWLNRKLYPTKLVGSTDTYANEIILPYPTIHSIESVIAEDENLDDVVLSSVTEWKFDCVNQTVRFRAGNRAQNLGRIRVVYNCGYGINNEAVPPAVKHAILMTAATLYENREDSIVGTQINEVPLDAQRILRVHRNRAL